MLEVLDKEAFKDYLFDKSIINIRFAFLIFSIIYLILEISVIIISPHSKNIYLTQQTFMLIWCVFALVFSFSKSFKNHYHLIMDITVLIMSCANLVAIAVAKKEELGYIVTYNSLFLILVVTNTLFRVKLWVSVLNGITIISGFCLIFIFHQPGLATSRDRITFCNNTFFLLITFAAAIICNYLLDHYMRKDCNNIVTINQANLKLQELDKIKSKFFANISHEFRTPLTLILSPIEAIIQGDYGKTVSYKHSVFKTIHHNSVRLLKLINNLLDFSKLEAGKMTIHSQKIVISTQLDYYLTTISSAAENKGLKITYQNYTTGLNTNIDPDLFEKVITNLLSNAMKFTPPGGSIKVELREITKINSRTPVQNENGYFQISVADTGIGIPADKLQLIFERFSQLDNSSSRKYQGTGIGLALTKEIVELLGGTIEVISKIGHGSTFIITLPLKNQAVVGNEAIPEELYLSNDIENGQAPPQLQTEKTRTNSSPCRILIVEDNLEMLVFLTTMLEKEYDVITATDGLKGLTKAEESLPDLILADVMMPEMDGYKMTAELRKNPTFQSVPIILLTAKAETSMKVEGLESGATDYIIKPFNARELMARIKAQLEMKLLRDEISRQRDEISLRNEAIVKSEIRFREMADFLPSAIIETNQNFEITYFNQATTDILGISGPELQKRNCLKTWVHPEELARFNREMRAVLENSIPNIYQYKIQNREREDYLVLLKASPFWNQDNLGLRIAMIEIDDSFNLVELPDESFYQNYKITAKEKAILIEVLSGKRLKEISKKYFITESTIKTHITHLFQKTGVKSRSELLKLIDNFKS